MKNWKKIVPFIAIGLFVCSVVGYNVTAKAQEEDKIADKVTIGGIITEKKIKYIFVRH